MQTYFVTSRDGVRIGYRCAGLGPAAILVHGLQRTSDVWLPLASQLSQTRQLILPDLRGRGISDCPTNRDSYRFERLVDDLEAVVRDAGAPVDIIGWSMGASVALGLADRNAASSVRSWVLVSPLLDPQDTRRLFCGGDIDDIESQARRRAEERAIDRAADPRAVASTWMALLEVDWLAVTPPIELPVLIVHGLRDEECSVAAANSLAARLPQGRLLLLPAAGHNPIADEPTVLHDAITQFWDRSPSMCSATNRKESSNE